MLNGLDLFSGIGGIGQALSPWVKTVAYCEAERYAQAVLLSRMARGEIDAGPIWDDVRTLEGEMLPKGIDIIFGGFPCQDVSVAGVGKGLGEGTRSGLFREIVRLAGELRPSFVFLENVAAITIRGGGDVVSAFAQLGYECRWITLAASEIGASHGRNRWWMLAHATSKRRNQNNGIGKPGQFDETDSERMGDSVADADHGRRQQCDQGQRQQTEFGEGRPPAPSDAEGWRKYLEANPTLEPAICGSPAWLQSRSNRIRALGNSVDVVCAREAFKILSGLKEPTNVK